MTLPPKPPARPGRVSLLRYLRLFRADILSAQPAHLYRARMAEFRAPFLHSFLVNEPDLIREVLSVRPQDFPKSSRVTAGLRPLLGRSVFVTNGEAWARQRRLIDPAFDGGRVRAAFPAMLDAARAAALRLAPGRLDAEPAMSHATADVIFRALFSVPIEDGLAAAVFAAFRDHQRDQPLLGPAAALPALARLRFAHRRRTRRTAAVIRDAIARMVDRRSREIADGTAPDDLATRLMTASDPASGQGFSPAEMVDQVAIFFLAGHETSASTLAWALWLLATHPDARDRAADEARAFMADPAPGALAGLSFIRDVVRETLRLYPPVPMMVREATRPEAFRGRKVPPGAQIVLSPWHLHRHERLWDAPDAFDPARWGRDWPKGGYMPFSAGPRICPGAGFALTEAQVILAALLARWHIAPSGEPPVPVAHLTVRSRDGIWLDVAPRD